MSACLNLSRRDLLRGVVAGGGLLLGTHLVPGAAVARARGSAEGAWEPDLFLSIDRDGLVTIVAHRSEMGTGIRTSLPMVVADELGCDWESVRVRQAIGDARYGSQNTDGSRSIRRFIDPMRVVGATARKMLERAAALEWDVDEAGCVARGHGVEHTESGRSLSFADLVERASTLEVPARDELRFRSPEERRYVGRGVPIVDRRGLVDGSATFGIDAAMDGMLYAVVARSPVVGGRLVSYDAEATLAVDGVVDVVEIPAFLGAAPQFQALGGVAVLATNTWAAMQGRDRLSIEWEDGGNASFDSEAFRTRLEASAREPGRVVRDVGDVDAALAGAEQVIEADYYTPLLAHASMEPPCALALVEDDRCEVWAPTQNPQAAQQQVAASLEIPIENVVVHVTLLGGGFGRKSKPDFIAEAALLSRETGAPIKLQWTREDDVRHDYYHTTAAVHLEAGLDDAGKCVAWLQRSAFPPIGSTFDPRSRSGSSGELSQGLTDVPYELANHRVESGQAAGHVRIGWLRSVCHVFHAFAVCGFTDELAVAAGRDPLDYLLELIGEPRHLDLSGVEYPNHGESLERYPYDTGRLANVTRLAAEQAGWGRELPRGSGLGIACHRSFLSYVAMVVEVAVDGRRGRVSIPRVDVAVDCGLVVHPDRVRAQLEGACTFGASLALMGEITARAGRIEQGNFNDYPVARLHQAPREVRVHLVESDAPPGGVGEIGVPPFAPALVNAVHAATGKRVRSLPLSRHDLTWS